MSDVVLVIRMTQTWIRYGILAHTIICTVVAAVEGLLGR